MNNLEFYVILSVVNFCHTSIVPPTFPLNPPFSPFILSSSSPSISPQNLMPPDPNHPPILHSSFAFLPADVSL